LFYFSSLCLQAEVDKLMSQKDKATAAAASATNDDNDNDDDPHVIARAEAVMESVQAAIATTMVYLKGHLLLLRPNDKAFLNQAIASCAAGFELKLFREAHLCIKRAVLEVRCLQT
jgi:hypothetical protein